MTTPNKDRAKIIPILDADDIAWGATKLDYAQPDSDVDMGELFFWANKWHEKYQAACANKNAEIAELQGMYEKQGIECYRRIKHLEAPPSDGEIEAVANVVRVELNQWDLDRIDGKDLSYTSIEHEITKAAITKLLEMRS